ncbi:hypothetical protein D1AOALGA4SA_4309 [Olavius algarvensis Delta 1 endosymbiont]|nr:hypothetical protein D1AOALGA4SA_4309 [Olavius algarvensis Delta 1 endosymbiont]
MTTKEEQQWFRKFYEGTFLVKGWQSRMEEVLQAVPDSDKDTVEELLSNLGEKIGREWARENRVRRINTAMIQNWGEDLRRFKKKGADVLTEELRRLDAEVDKILS